MNYIDLGPKLLLDRVIMGMKFATGLIFIYLHSGAESADAIAETLNKKADFMV